MIVLISVLALREVTVVLTLVSKKVTTKYNHRHDSSPDHKCAGAH
jgi:hypothetical protein